MQNNVPNVLKQGLRQSKTRMKESIEELVDPLLRQFRLCSSILHAFAYPCGANTIQHHSLCNLHNEALFR
jgi:hypothetical protein